MMIKRLAIAMLLVLAMALPAFAGGSVIVGSTANVASGNFGRGSSFEMAGNSSQAGVSANLTTTSWNTSFKCFGITYTIGHSTYDLNASTYAQTGGSTFGNGIGFQSGFASALGTF